MMRMLNVTVLLTGLVFSSAAIAQPAEAGLVRGVEAVGKPGGCGVDLLAIAASVRATLVGAGYAIGPDADDTYRVEFDSHKGTGGGCSARVKVLRRTSESGDIASDADSCGWARVLGFDPADITSDLADYAATFAARCIRRDQDSHGIAGQRVNP